ncbi:MAG: hypothetical protein H7A51_14975 [Akkermansiaceae bacterium]|nr:hypothetical protein [Akkermansiaceae bacterium]
MKSITPLFFLTLASVAAMAQTSVPSYQQALEVAKESGQDICCYLYGSNWNRVGNLVKQQLWDNKELAAAIGEGVILTAVDHPDGMPAAIADNQLAPGFEKLPPMSRLSSVTMKGTTYSKLDDESWGIDLKRKPRRETAVIKLTTMASPVRGVFVSVLKDPRQPDAVYAVSGLRLKTADQPVKVVAASSNKSMDRLMLAFDGSGGYASYIQHRGEALHILVMPEKTIPANTELTIELDFKGKPWCQMGTRLAVSELAANAKGYDTLVSETRRIFDYYRILSENRGIPAGTNNYPAIVYVDSKGRYIGKKDALRTSHTVGDLAGFIEGFRKQRIARDAAWTAARQATGEKKAELLSQGLDAIGCSQHTTKGAWAGYAPVFDEIKKLALPATHPITTRYFYNWKAVDTFVNDLVREGNEAKALSTLDFELTKSLTPGMRETIMMKKFSICQNSKSAEVKKLTWQALRQLATEFPHTRRGIGARGMLLWKGDEGPVTFTYGWKARHLKEGENTWKIDLDTAKAFYTAEPHDIQFTLDKKSPNGLTITSIEIFEGDKLLTSLTPNVTLSKEAPTYKGRVDLSRRTPKPGAAPLVVVCKVTPVGGTNCFGTISATPQLPPPPAENW